MAGSVDGDGLDTYCRMPGICSLSELITQYKPTVESDVEDVPSAQKKLFTLLRHLTKEGTDKRVSALLGVYNQGTNTGIVDVFLVIGVSLRGGDYTDDSLRPRLTSRKAQPKPTQLRRGEDHDIKTQIERTATRRCSTVAPTSRGSHSGGTGGGEAILV